MTLKDLESLIDNRIFDIGIYISRENWVEIIITTGFTRCYDELGEFFWIGRNKIRSSPAPTILIIN